MENRKTPEQKYIFQIGTLSPHGINESFSHSANLSVVFHVTRHQPILSAHKLHTTHNSSICSDEGLTLATSAFESLYGGQFTLSTQLIKPNYPVILPPTQHHSVFRNLPHSTPVQLRVSWIEQATEEVMNWTSNWGGHELATEGVMNWTSRSYVFSIY